MYIKTANAYSNPDVDINFSCSTDENQRSLTYPNQGLPALVGTSLRTQSYFHFKNYFFCPFILLGCVFFI